MIRFELGVEDLADTRFAISPLAETVGSLWVLSHPDRFKLHRPWYGMARERCADVDLTLLLSLVGPTLALPDFLTPRPETFAPSIQDQLARVRTTPAAVVARDLLATHAPQPVPAILEDVHGGDAAVVALRDRICRELWRYWQLAILPVWPQIRSLLEADTTHRARQLATGGARRLFADMHPNLVWDGGVLHIHDMIGRHRVAAAGRGLLLVPSVFAYKPVPPLSAEEPPVVAYPARGLATLWAPQARRENAALAALLGSSRAALLEMLEEPLATAELARRLAVTPSAISQHLKILHGNGLVTRARAGRHVLYRRTTLGHRLVGAR